MSTCDGASHLHRLSARYVSEHRRRLLACVQVELASGMAVEPVATREDGVAYGLGVAWSWAQVRSRNMLRSCFVMLLGRASHAYSNLADTWAPNPWATYS